MANKPRAGGIGTSGAAGAGHADEEEVVAQQTLNFKEQSDATTPAPYQIYRSHPPQLNRHDISDEELGALGDMRRDYLWEGMWVALGGATGAAPGAVVALVNGYLKNPPIPISLADLIQILFLFVGAVLFLVLVFVMKNRNRDARDLVQEIRDRSKSRVAG